MGAPVSKAQLARYLGVSPGRVSQLIGQGMPVRADGRMDVEQAEEWYLLYVAQRKHHSPASGDLVREVVEAAEIDFANRMRMPRRLECFARAAIAFGCTPRQAFALVEFLQLWLICGVRLADDERAFVQPHPEPDWAAIAAEAGEAADVPAWREWWAGILNSSCNRLIKSTR